MKEDGFAESFVHPSIRQGERPESTVSICFSVRGEVSNHERKTTFFFLMKPSNKGELQKRNEFVLAGTRFAESVPDTSRDSAWKWPQH
jgi:hypothetical protein